YGTTPQYLVAAGVPAANADLVTAGAVTAFNKATGARVAASDIRAAGSISAAVADYGSAQAVIFSIAIDTNLPRASGTVDFFVNGGAIIGQNADYIIYGTTPQYLVAAGVTSANADLVTAGAVVAFNRATGARVAGSDIRAAGSISAAPADFGVRQPISFTVAIDPSSPQACGTVDFIVSAGTVIGQNATYIIYGVTPTYLAAADVGTANADLVAAGQVTAFNLTTGAKMAKGDIQATGSLSATPALHGVKQAVTYTLAIDPTRPKASGMVEFIVCEGAVLGQSDRFIIFGESPRSILSTDLAQANADLVAAGKVRAFEKATGTPVDPSDIAVSGGPLANVVGGPAQSVRYEVSIDPTAPKAFAEVVFTIVSLSRSHTLSYNGNGNDSGRPPDPVSCPEGADVIVAGHSMGRSGHHFTGYSEDPLATAASYQPGDTITLSRDLTLYALWTKDRPANPVSPITGDSLLLLQATILGLLLATALFLIWLRLRRKDGDEE
ncbi:MAG: hypothetical protein LBG81_05480, partial [Coriobacteriaceae bacterium]|nr:hypothetical protein [Coriobacteriaceae bacterium]